MQALAFVSRFYFTLCRLPRASRSASAMQARAFVSRCHLPCHSIDFHLAILVQFDHGHVCRIAIGWACEGLSGGVKLR